MFVTISIATKAFLLEERHFSLVGSWFLLDHSFSSRSCVTLSWPDCKIL